MIEAILDRLKLPASTTTEEYKDAINALIAQYLGWEHKPSKAHKIKLWYAPKSEDCYIMPFDYCGSHDTIHVAIESLSAWMYAESFVTNLEYVLSFKQIEYKRTHHLKADPLSKAEAFVLTITS